MTVSESTYLQAAFEEYCIQPANPDYARYIESVRQGMPFPGQDQAVYLIYDNLQGQIQYFSDTYRLFGYRANDPVEFGQFFTCLVPQHADYTVQAANWLPTLSDRIPATLKADALCYHCGMHVVRADGRVVRVLSSAHKIKLDEALNPCVTLIIMQDVTHLYKGEHYWMRAAFGAEGQTVFYYRSDEKQTITGDIVSSREKQVLSLLYEGCESKEIGDRLGISAETVHQHRRNMIARTGARDTTALLQLAQWCNLL
jgi:DNA-binding CsgD family transcriptional regulator